MTIIKSWQEYDIFMSEVHDEQLEPELEKEFQKVYENLTDKLKTLEELYKSWKKLELFLESINLDELGLVVDVNSKFYKLFEENK